MVSHMSRVTMGQWRAVQQLLVGVVVGSSLAACGSGPGSGYIDCGSGLPFAAVASSDLKALPSQTEMPEAPSDWEPLTLDQLTLQAPPPAAEPILTGNEDSASRRCLSWNGALFSTESGREADELLLLTATSGKQLEELVGDAGAQFTQITVPGAEAAVARLSEQQYLDGGGEPVDGQRTTVIDVALQVGDSTYTVSGSFAPGSAGEDVTAALVSSLAVK